MAKKHHKKRHHHAEDPGDRGMGRETRDYNHDDYQPEHYTRDGFEGDGRGHVRGTTGYYPEGGNRTTTGHYPQTEGQMSRFGQRDMIQEDRSKTANLPQDVKMIAYPNSYGFLPGDYLDDTIHGIDEQKELDHKGMM